MGLAEWADQPAELARPRAAEPATVPAHPGPRCRRTVPAHRRPGARPGAPGSRFRGPASWPSAPTPTRARTLRHELAHLVLHDAVQVPMPLWFEEGYAVYAAGRVGPARCAEPELRRGRRGRRPGLDSLNRALRGHPAGISTAYALSASAVLELARRNPSRSLTPLVERLSSRDGRSIRRCRPRRASRRRTSTRRGSEGVRKRYSLFTWLAAGGAWALLALALMAGTYWRRRADRRRRSALDEGWELPPEPEMQAAQALDPTTSGE